MENELTSILLMFKIVYLVFFLGILFNTPEEVAFLIIRNWLFGGIIIAALIGLGTWLYYNPASLFLQLFVTVLIAGIIFLVIRAFMRRKNSYKENRSYAKAAKFSRKKYEQPKKSAHTNKSTKRPLRKKSTAHLTVIEGKKGKKKDRAIF